jgi:hypothetical protein
VSLRWLRGWEAASICLWAAGCAEVGREGGAAGGVGVRGGELGPSPAPTSPTSAPFAVKDAARKKSGGGRWVRETREVKASPQRAHKRCNQPGRKETEKIGVPWGPGFGCFKVRASQALRLSQCSKLEKLQPESAARPSGHLRKRALGDWNAGGSDLPAQAGLGAGPGTGPSCQAHGRTRQLTVDVDYRSPF